MPISTSSMYQNATNQNPRRQQARHLWAEFRTYAIKARHGMHERRNMALQDMQREWQTRPGRTQQDREQQRLHIMKLHEKQHYLEMREEWQRMLHNNGLKHEDWGEVTAQEMAAIRQILGPDDIEDEEEEEGSSGHGAEPQHFPPSDFVAANIVPQPLSQSVSHQSQASFSSQSSLSSNNQSYAAPSLASRSQNTSSASYAFVDPRKFTDDEREDFPTIPFLGRRGSAYAMGSEDEDNGISVPNYKSWSSRGQQQTSGFTTRPNNSSNPSSLSSSPIDAPPSRFHNQLSSSVSSSSHFPPHIPSSLSKSVAVEDDADRIFTAAMKGTSSSSAAAGKSKSKLRSGYIGPQLTTNDSENEADADLASMSRTDQIAAYERFKKDTRIRKIREFHDEAAKLDIELTEKINGSSDTSFDMTGGLGEGHNGYDKVWVARVIAQHEQDMLKLRAKKEEERKRLVEAERARMSAEIKKGRTRVPTAGTPAAKKAWGSSSNTTTKSSVNAKTSVPTPSSPFSTANKTPLAPTQKPKTPMASTSAMRQEHMDLDELQMLLQNAPDLPLDTAFQMTQLLSGGAGDFGHGQEHDQDWNTPQIRHKPSTNFPTAAPPQGTRKRTDSVSVLDEARFGSISAKGKQRRDTITASSAAAANNSSTNSSNGFWRPQPQLSSPEQIDDPYANVFIPGAPPIRGSLSKPAMQQADDADDWAGWGSKPTAPAKANGGGKTTSASNSASGSAWTTKKTAQSNVTSSPTVTPASGWGASVKKSFGFGNSQWGDQRSQQAKDQEEAEEADEEEEAAEEDHDHPSPFGGQSSQKWSSSLLSDMMTKGKNVVAGAVGAALSPVNAPAPPSPGPGQARRKGAQVPAPPAPKPSTPPAATTTTGKKTTKKGRQATTGKKATVSPTRPDEESQESETQQQQPTTPRASASSTKFTSSFGSPTTSGGFSFGSPTRNTSSSTGIWEDMMSTTPRPVAGAHVRKPSGLHHQVWNAGGGEDAEEEQQEREEREEEQEEQEEEQEEEADAGDDEWNMPGSLRIRGAPGANLKGGRFGSGVTPSAKPTTKKNATQTSSPLGAWGSSPSSTTKPIPPTTSKSKRKASLAGKRPVTMEEVPDESDNPSNRSPSSFLASDSRVILEPKPSKPSVLFDDIIQFSGENSSPEQTRRPLMSSKQQRMAAASANVDPEEEEEEEEDGFYGEAWFQKAAMQLKQGTEEGAKLFGASAQPQPVPAAKGGKPGNKTSAWGTPSSNVAGSFADSPPPMSGAPPKSASSALGDSTNTPKRSAWGSAASSKPQPSVGIGFGKGANGKAKATTETSGFGASGFGTSGFGTSVFGWGSGSTSGANDDVDQENEPWGDGSRAEEQWDEAQNEEDVEREKNLLDSRKRLQDLFGESTSSNSKPAAKVAPEALMSAAAKVRALKEERAQEEQARLEREEQEREEQAAQEREAQEREIQEKATKEKELPAIKTTGNKTGAAKRGKKKR